MDNSLEYFTALPTLYHVTLAKNLDCIQKIGLLPQIGERSRIAEEQEPAVYLFASKEDMEQALLGWLGEEFEDEDISVLKILLPESYRKFLCCAGFEVQCKKIIPPQYINVLSAQESMI